VEGGTDRAGAGRVQVGRGVIENKHSTNVEYPPLPPRFCLSIHTQGKWCSDIGRVLVVNDAGGRIDERMSTLEEQVYESKLLNEDLASRLEDSNERAATNNAEVRTSREELKKLRKVGRSRLTLGWP